MFDTKLLLSAIILVLIDSVYLNIIKDYFGKQVRAVQKSPLKINMLGAVLCYIFLIVAMNYFIIQQKRSIQDAFLLGIIIYGVFETTNYALFEDWYFFTIIIDTLWGGTLFALTLYILKIFFRL